MATSQNVIDNMGEPVVTSLARGPVCRVREYFASGVRKLRPRRSHDRSPAQA